MKRIFVLTLVFLVGAGSVCAQSKVERYCTVSMHNKAFTSRVTIDLRLGEHPEYFTFKDSTILRDLSKVNEMQTVADALNYMASIGWKMAGRMYDPGSGYGWFFFKREFDPSELANQ